MRRTYHRQVKPAPPSRIACLNSTEWQAALGATSFSALQQSWAYGEMMLRIGRQVDRWIWQDGNSRVLAAAQIITRRIGPIKIVTALRAPCFTADCSDAQKRDILADVSRLYHRHDLKFLFLMPELPDTESSRALFRGTGRHRIITGYPTALLNISDDLEKLFMNFKDTWRNKIRKAEQSGLQIKIVRGGPLLQWLLGKEKEQITEKGYQTIAPELIEAWIEKILHPQDVWGMIALQGKQPISGQLWLRHGNAATYYVGATTTAGRAAAAHNLLFWHAVQELKAAGVAMLDLGGVDSVTNPGLARFKLETGAKAHLLIGSYH